MVKVLKHHQPTPTDSIIVLDTIEGPIHNTYEDILTLLSLSGPCWP